ncbi:MAG TPA: TRAP transporter small permease [Alphaproteobacteria bacterium]|jgi:C4-dicarboxylate transporter DctQ subunit
MLTLLDRAVAALIGLIAASLLATAFGQVVARYVFDRPFTWVLELDVILLVWLTMLAGYVGVRRNLHMAVDFVVAKWRPGARRAAALASLALSAGFTGVLLWASFPVIDAMEGMSFASLGLAQNWMYWSVPVGAALMLIAFAAELGRHFAPSGGAPRQ